MNKELLIEIGDRMRLRRKQMNLTQEKTAELLDISTTYYGELERGNRKLSLELIIRIYEQMNLTPDFLLLGQKYSQFTLDGLLSENIIDNKIIFRNNISELVIVLK